jgi:ATP-dependent protease ClpP protease subunit
MRSGTNPLTNPFWRFRNEAAEEADLLIYGTIGDWDGWDDTVPKRFAEDLAKVTANRLNIRINSPGGDVFAGQAIYSQLKSWNKEKKREVVARVDGLAASAASLVAMAADRIIMPKNSTMMIHNPWSAACGEAKDFRKAADTLDVIREGLVAAYAAKTGLSEDRIKGMLDDETWMTAGEAKALGFADEVDGAASVEASLRGGGRILAAGGMEFDLSRFARRPNVGNGTAEEAAGEGIFSRAMAKVLARLSGAGGGGIPAGIVPAGGKEIEEEADIVTSDELKEEYPEIAAAIAAEARAEGVASERERIRSLEELAPAGGGELLVKAKYGEPMDAKTFALCLVRSEKENRNAALAALRADAAEVKVSSAPLGAVDDGDAMELQAMRDTAKRVSEQRRKRG